MGATATVRAPAHKKQSDFKSAVRKTTAKTKAYVGKKTEQVKAYRRQIKKDRDAAYDIGFQCGWDEAYNVPKRYGTRAAAARGFKKGVVNRYRSDKYANHRRSK